MTRKPQVFGSIQPRGTIHTGNYLGAIKNRTAVLDACDCVSGVVDNHVMIISYD